MERYKPTPDGTFSLAAAREHKSQIASERRRVMHTLYSLGEEEVQNIHQLALFSEHKVTRGMLITDDRLLHEADSIDSSIEWLNRGASEELTELKEKGITPESSKIDLLLTGQKLVTFAHELERIQRININLEVWEKEFNDLVEQLYNAVISRTHTIPKVYGEIRRKRLELVSAIRDAFDIDDDRWMDYVTYGD